ncbi:114_t:CDS:2 [Funneliformis geosporum]|uniref:114_t:CDS:1 n=1 Tax=Funneliformis geosporum TaxID=1117311 RepID=A0A9W4WW74_9GLOM|nr:114_t:CDS:2 [Funneliformis geosporum]
MVSELRESLSKWLLHKDVQRNLEDTSIGAWYERDIKLIKFHGIHHQDDRDERKAKFWKMLFNLWYELEVLEDSSMLNMDKIAEIDC